MPRQVSEVEKRFRASPTLESRRAAMYRRNVTSQVSHAKESSRTFLEKSKLIIEFKLINIVAELITELKL
jgi:hypothetical protein